MTQINNRIYYFDFIRFFQMFVVVYGHCLAGFKAYNQTVDVGLIDILGIVWCSPILFLFVSGAILLDPDKQISNKDIYTKYVSRILIGILLFGFLYLMYMSFINVRDFMHVENFDSFIQSFFASMHYKIFDLWRHPIIIPPFWFLYAILLLYLLLPLFRWIVKKSSQKSLLAFILVLVIIFEVFPSVNKYLLLVPAFDVSRNIKCIVWYFIGYYCHKYSTKSKLKFWIYLICCIICAVFTAFSVNSNFLILEPLSPLFILLDAIFLFLLFSYMNKDIKICYKFSKYCYGIFLVHMFFILTIFIPDWINDAFGAMVYCFVYAIFVFIISLIIVWLLRKNKFIKKYIL